MRYLSKGMVIKESTKQTLRVTRCGMDYMLTGIGAKLWLAGRFQLNESGDTKEERHLRELERLGLVELSEDADPLAVYRLLARCIVCPAKLKSVRLPLSPMENQVWQWVSEAGLRLTIGELVKLFTENVAPSPDLLGKDNAQDLTLRIYAGDLQFDTTPDLQMEASPKRDAVTEAVLELLKKKRLVLI